jgi:ferredoxin-NADP reductase
MIGLIEGAGVAIVGAALAQAGVGLAGTLQRRARQARQEQADAKLFERRATALLRAAEAERAKKELSWTGLRKFTIERKVMEANDICSFYLKPHDHKPLPPFRPGQYLTFQLRIPDQPKPVVRCYSLSDGPVNLDRYRVTIKRLPPPRDKPEAPPGLSSSYFHESLQEGDIVDVRAPNGHFHLDESTDKPVVLIGGGVGLTPMLSMLNTICETGSGRETWFFYGVRHGGEHAFKEHLQEIDRNHPNVHVVACYSEPREEDRKGVDYEAEGHVSVDLMKRMLGAPNYEFYICGPPPMMKIITEGLEEWGVPESAINYEAFGPATVKKKPHPQPAQQAEAQAADEGVEVEFARSGKKVAWRPDDGAILDLAEANGVSLDFGCRAGNCGTCVTAVKEGDVTYLSEPGVPPEQGSCLSCIAVPKGRVVLDA